jgi:ABC-type nitrate/sulfonate/bicarbonate transport system ATPase subunit
LGGEHTTILIPAGVLQGSVIDCMRNELLRILEEERHTVMLITHDVEEAIHLADRIMVLSPRPTRIQAMFKVDLPHPRKLTSPEVQELRVAILHELGVDRNAG